MTITLNNKQYKHIGVTHKNVKAVEANEELICLFYDISKKGKITLCSTKSWYIANIEDDK